MAVPDNQPEGTHPPHQFETSDGTPVEPSILLPKHTVGEVDEDSRPGIHRVKSDTKQAQKDSDKPKS